MDKKKVENFDKYIPLIQILITKESIDALNDICNDIFRTYFMLFSNTMNYKDGYNFFKLFINLEPRSTFSAARGYFLYFAYQMKDFSEIDDIMNSIVVETNYKTQLASNDFSLYCLYKGLIHLAREEYVMAAFSFCCCLATGKSGRLNFMDCMQIEAVKRLFFLVYLVDEEFTPLIISVLEKYELLKMSSKFSPFFDLKKNSGCDKFENWINGKKTFLKSNGLFGIAKKALWETRFRTVKSTLMKYKRIKLAKLSNMVGIDFLKVKKVIEKNVAKNRINVKYDEVEDILEVFKCNMNNPQTFDELKKYYQYLVAASQDLFSYDMTKNKSLKKMSKLSQDDYKRLMMEQQEEMYCQGEEGLEEIM